MAPEHSDDEIRRTWQEQRIEEDAMMTSDVRARAAAFEARIRRQDLGGFIAIGIVVIANIVEVLLGTDDVERLGDGLNLCAALFVLYSLRRARTAVTRPASLGLTSSIDFYRAEVLRRRGMLKNFWLRCALPFVPGIFLSTFGHMATKPVPLSRYAALAAGFAVLVAGIAWANHRKARKLQAEIDAIDGVR